MNPALQERSRAAPALQVRTFDGKPLLHLAHAPARFDDVKIAIFQKARHLAPWVQVIMVRIERRWTISRHAESYGDTTGEPQRDGTSINTTEDEQDDTSIRKADETSICKADDTCIRKADDTSIRKADKASIRKADKASMSEEDDTSMSEDGNTSMSEDGNTNMSEEDDSKDDGAKEAETKHGAKTSDAGVESVESQETWQKVVHTASLRDFIVVMVGSRMVTHADFRAFGTSSCPTAHLLRNNGNNAGTTGTTGNNVGTNGEKRHSADKANSGVFSCCLLRGAVNVPFVAGLHLLGVVALRPFCVSIGPVMWQSIQVCTTGDEEGATWVVCFTDPPLPAVSCGTQIFTVNAFDGVQPFAATLYCLWKPCTPEQHARALSRGVRTDLVDGMASVTATPVDLFDGMASVTATPVAAKASSDHTQGRIRRIAVCGGMLVAF